MFSSLHPEQLKDLVASAGPTAQAGTVEQAVEFGDVILLVVPYTAVEQIGKDYGKALAAKQLVIDVSNPIARARRRRHCEAGSRSRAGPASPPPSCCRARISFGPSTRSTTSS